MQSRPAAACQQRCQSHQQYLQTEKYSLLLPLKGGEKKRKGETNVSGRREDRKLGSVLRSDTSEGRGSKKKDAGKSCMESCYCMVYVCGRMYSDTDYCVAYSLYRNRLDSIHARGRLCGERQCVGLRSDQG